MQRRRTQRPIPTYMNNMPSKQTTSVRSCEKEYKGKKNQLNTSFIIYEIRIHKNTYTRIRKKERPRRPTAPQPFSSKVETNVQTKPFSHSTLSLFLQERKPHSPVIALSRQCLRKKNERKLSELPLLFLLHFSVSQPSLFSEFEMPTLSSSSFFSFIAQGGV